MFLVKGEYQKGKERITFNMVVNEKDEKKIHEKVLSEIGGNHKVRRNKIKINGVEKIGK